MIIKGGLLLLFIFNIIHGFAQVRHLQFAAVFGAQKLQLGNQKYSIQKEDSLSIDVLKFYVSNLELLKNKVILHKFNNAYFLVDFSNEKSTAIEWPNNLSSEPDEIRFNIGIDSITNYGGALGGDLDPTLGMYWTWQNGYINIKLEGKSTACNTQNNKFEFHIGGYNYPFSTLQEIAIPLFTTGDVFIEMDLKKILNSHDLSKSNHIMSPCKEAVEFSKQFQFIFTVRE